MHRYELTDAQWACLAPFFPDRYHDDQPGHPWWTHRRMVNGILWHLHTGAPWRDPPNATGPGRPSTTASIAGAGTALGPKSSTPCRRASTSKGSSTAT